jgi:hypothetical protein
LFVQQIHSLEWKLGLAVFFCLVGASELWAEWSEFRTSQALDHEAAAPAAPPPPPPRFGPAQLMEFNEPVEDVQPPQYRSTWEMDIESPDGYSPRLATIGFGANDVLEVDLFHHGASFYEANAQLPDGRWLVSLQNPQRHLFLRVFSSEPLTGYEMAFDVQ